MTEHSDALDLEDGWFKKDPAEMAAFAETVDRARPSQEGTPFQSAMSMMPSTSTAPATISGRDSKRHEPVEDELRRFFHRDD